MFRKFIVMPPPMVPAPITPTLRISRRGVSPGKPSSLEAARSALKMCRNARDSGLCNSKLKASRSTSMPWSKLFVNAAKTASTDLRRDGSKARSLPADTMLRAKAMNASPCASLIRRSRVRTTGRFSETISLANLTAAATTSCSTTRSSNRVVAILLAVTLSPLRIRLSAGSRPMRRGRRCVPPAPGRSPSLTSGSPSFASAWATRKCAPRASSKPPPRQTPAMAAITGLGLSSTARMTGVSRGSREAWGVLNSVMSAPPEKARGVPVSTMARTASSALALSSACRMSARNG